MTTANLHTWAAAIKDGNADYATCCVYADWLEDHGVALSATWRDGVCLTPIYGDGNGDGDGDGNGNGNGDGDGYGDGYGYGNGDGDGYGDGYGNGNGNGYGNLIRERRFIVDGVFVFRVKDRWSFFGNARMDPNDSTRLIIDNCKCIRIWGTSRGIGQLAISGPTKESVIDPMGDGVSVLRSEISFAIPVSEAAIKEWMKIK